MTTFDFSLFVCKVCMKNKFVFKFLVNAYEALYKQKALHQNLSCHITFKYHIYSLSHNDITLVVNCNNTIHYKTKKKLVGAFGMAFIMKQKFIIQLKKTLEFKQV